MSHLCGVTGIAVSIVISPTPAHPFAAPFADRVGFVDSGANNLLFAARDTGWHKMVWTGGAPLLVAALAASAETALACGERNLFLRRAANGSCSRPTSGIDGGILDPRAPPRPLGGSRHRWDDR